MTADDEVPYREPRLSIALSDLRRADDYGVDGSTFYSCKLCDQESGAGVLNKGIPHLASCPVGRYEKRLAKRLEKARG